MHGLSIRVGLVFEAAEYVHVVLPDAGRVAVAGVGDVATGLGRRPAVPHRVEAEEDGAGRVVVAAAPHVDLVLVDDGRVAVPLVGQDVVVLEVRQVAHWVFCPSKKKMKN